MKIRIFSDKIEFDFSIVSDMNYYNGFVFKGYLENIPSKAFFRADSMTAL